MAECNLRAVAQRAILRNLVEFAAIPGSTSVYAALLAYQNSALTGSFKQGRVTVGTSGNGQSVSFQIAGLGAEYSQADAVGLSERLLEVYEDMQTNTPQADDGQPANSRAVFALMRDDDRLQTVTRKGSDWTLLNWPLIGNLNAGQ